MVLIKNISQSQVNSIVDNYKGEVITNTDVNKLMFNNGTEFTYLVYSDLNNVITGLSGLSATNLTGTLQTAAQPNVTSLGTLTGLTVNNNLVVAQHNGVDKGLTLGGTLVTSSAAQLNYVNTTPGTAEAGKALITDSNNSIVGLTNLETDNLTVNGTLVTSSAIELNYVDVDTLGIAQASKALVVDADRNITNINTLEADFIQVNGTLVTSSAIELNYVDVDTLGIAQASKALVVDANRNISNLGDVSAVNLTGTLQTADQSNITKVGTLQGLTVTGTTSVENLVVNGVPLNAFSLGGLKLRAYSTPDFSGRVVKADVITSVDFTNYEPVTGLTENYSMEIWGYVKPLYTESYTFTVSSNDRFRLWVNNELVRTEWTDGDDTNLQTSPISLTAGQWYPIYIQHAQYTGTEKLSVNWTSVSQTSELLPASALAYDDKASAVTARKSYTQDSLVLYDGVNSNLSYISTDSSGNLNITSGSNNVNVVGHNGSTVGLKLNGTLVTSTAVELNYVDTTPGSAEASKALVFDSSKNIVGVNDVSLNALTSLDTTQSTSSTTGAIKTAGGLGVAKNVNVGGALGVTGDSAFSANVTVDGPSFKLPRGDTASRPTGALGQVRYNTETSQFEGFGAGNTWGSLGGVTDVDQNTKILAEDSPGANNNELKFFNDGAETMRLTAVGSLGLGTTTPSKKLEINSSTGDVLRMTYNDADGSAVNYVDMDVSADGKLTINSSGNETIIHSSDNFDVAGHNGSTLGLKLAGVLVTSTAAELNYVDTTPGTAEASKALVLNASRNISNINNLSMTGNAIVTGSTTTASVYLSNGEEDGSVFKMNYLSGYIANQSKTGYQWYSSSTDVLIGTKAMELDGSLKINVPTQSTDATQSTSVSTGAIVTAGGVGIAKNLNVGGDSMFAANVAVDGPSFRLPTGNTAARPTGVLGQVRYNTQTSQFEGFGAGSTWSPLGGAEIADVDKNTKITAEDSPGANNNELKFFNDGAETMRLTPLGSLGLGTTTPSKKLEINSSTGDVLRMTYNDPDGSAVNYVDMNVSADGKLTINSSGNETIIHSSDNFDVAGHDGSTLGLKLAGVLVTSTAAELNYVDTTPGAAEASKALVLDASRNINNINDLSTTTVVVIGTTDSTSSTTGALVVSGGLGLAKNLNVAGVVGFSNATQSTSASTGALVLAGGLGVAKNVNVGGALAVTGDSAFSANVTVDGPSFRLPTGNTAARPTGTLGQVRYNTETSQFEGFGAGSTWGSLGGVTDVDQNTKILAEDSPGANNNELKFFNDGAETMRLTAVGSLGLGTTTPSKKLEINSATGDVLRMTYNDADGSAVNYVDMNVSSDGKLTINSSGNETIIHSSDNFDVAGHNGSTLGLKLAGTLVTSTAVELNYVDTTPGAAEASKALVLDASKNITGINSISMNSLNLTFDDAVAGTVGNPLVITRTTSATPANGLGVGMSFKVENSANANVEFGNCSVVSTDITAASEDANFVINLLANGSMIESMRLSPTTMYVNELYETSDRRVKENFKEASLQETHERVMALKLVDYNYIGNVKTHRGLIAQEVEEVIPVAVETEDRNGISDFKSVSTREITNHLVGSIQHLSKQLELALARIAELESQK